MTLSVFQATITNENGDILPGAEVSVILESTGLAATIYSTRGGAALSNPFFADASGFAQFYANAGEYRIVVTSGAFSRTWRYVRLGDGGAKDVGTAATRDVGTAAGNVMLVGAGGWLYPDNPLIATDALDPPDAQFSSFQAATVNNPSVGGGGSFLGMPYNSGDNSRMCGLYIQNDDSRVHFYRKRTGVSEYFEGLTTSNTTVDVNGFVKAASPIVKLHSDRIEKNGDFTADFERIGTGHYLIKNTLGFAQEGWYVETPKDANGNVKVFVEYTDNGGDITVKTYEPDYSTGRAAAGVAVDIPVDRWIDIRLHELPTEPETEEAEE